MGESLAQSRQSVNLFPSVILEIFNCLPFLKSLKIEQMVIHFAILHPSNVKLEFWLCN